MFASVLSKYIITSCYVVRSWEAFPLLAKVNLADTGCVMAAGLSAPAGEEEAAGGLCSAPEGEGAARGALHLL